MSQDKGALEGTVSDRVRKALIPLKRCILFRNNVGKLPDRFGRWIQFGLCVGSSDWIGWTRYKIQAEDVGKQIAVFTGIETKREKGGDKREAQEIFIGNVTKDNGIAGFAESPEKAVELITTWRPQ